jgi:4-oxalomesaconate hydratase
VSESKLSESKLSESKLSESILVVSAHSADFVWRAAGAIATVTSAGGTANVVALSYGERGESGELWKEPGQTEARVKQIRHDEAQAAAAALGAEFQSLDLGDYPLVVDAAAVEQLTELIHRLEPQVIATHASRDPFNPDHAVAYEATVQARQLASGAGVASAFKTIAPPQFLLFEPHQPELCGFVPTTFLDITPVWDKKVAAMEAMGAQSYLKQYYSERAEHRANHARRISGRSDVRYAEAFQREIPVVVDGL